MRDFYFLRHGQTVLNAQKIFHDNSDVSLDDKGVAQAKAVAPLIETLPIQTIVSSPLKRVRETRSLVAQNINCQLIEMEGLRECSGATWLELAAWDFVSPLLPETALFLTTVKAAFEEALHYPGPVLVIAHGGVHWAFCHQFAVEGHEKRIGNCGAVHFQRKEEKWTAKVLA